MIKELVISAYERNYDWISKINNNVKITVYRKGDKCNIKNNEIYLNKNIGRDVHTFFYHLYYNYDFLYDCTCFSQDDPFDHVNNIVYILNNDINEIIKNYSTKLNIDNSFFIFNSYSMTMEENNNMGLPHHDGINWPLFNEKYNIDNIWNMLFDCNHPESYIFVPAGHFCITRKHVHKRPKYFYKKILDLFELDDTIPYVIERLESYIFDTKYKIK